MAMTQKFLQSGFITMDIFAATPVDEKKGQAKMVRRALTGPQAMSGIAAGEESGDQTGDVFIREVGKVSAPLNKAGLKLTPGSTSRIDVVVRTRKIGHAFPGGTLDSFDIWVEFQAKDATGKVIYWSGQVEEDGKGPVEKGAHFYRAYQLDGDGNPINKRNAWQSRSVLYVRQIPPGAADTAHYLLHIPKDAKGPITLTSKLNYRKFSRYYTQFAFAGVAKPGQDPSLMNQDSNSLEYSFDPKNVPANVSAKLKGQIPDIPITVLAEAKAEIPLTSDPKETQWNQVATKADRERWNDWGIGMLLQGDLKGAEYAFNKVTTAEPGYADGWLNVARALVQEGETDAAKPYIEKAMATDSKLGRIWYFRALIEKADGDYDGALKSLKVVTDKYPRDRVVLNQVARILFLQRKYKESIEALTKVQMVDPEDLQMHYTAMLAYRGLGDAANADREQKLFQRFKAEESAQSITGKRRLANVEENNERQTIHDHESVDLAARPIPASHEITNKGKAAPAVAKAPVKNGTNGGSE
jgi:tetratricopeptide (TPR) repeat protein